MAELKFSGGRKGGKMAGHHKWSEIKHWSRAEFDRLTEDEVFAAVYADTKAEGFKVAEKGNNRATTLPTDPQERKTYPIASGVLDYFPDAIAAVAHVSYVGNEQHNPGQPLHWAREKSQDQDDTIIRHFLERGTKDKDGLRHSAKLAWRALALLQLEIENETSNT